VAFSGHAGLWDPGGYGRQAHPVTNSQCRVGELAGSVFLEDNRDFGEVSFHVSFVLFSKVPGDLSFPHVSFES
jgi:hypothetical protein